MKLIKFLNICAIFLLAICFVLFFLLCFGLFSFGEDVIFQDLKICGLAIICMQVISMVNLLYFVYAEKRRKATKLRHYIFCELIMTAVPTIVLLILAFV